MARNFVAASTQKIDFGDVTELKSASTFTFSAWMRRSATSKRVMVAKGTAGIFETYLLMYIDGNIYVKVTSGIENFAAVTLDNTNWAHVTMVYDGGQAVNNDRVLLYVNGALQAPTYSGTFPATSSSSTAPLNAGKRDTTSQYADGDVAEVKIWTKTLSAKEIIQDFVGVIPRDTLVFHAPMGWDSPEPDISGSKYTGTLTNTPTIADHVPAPYLYGFDTQSKLVSAAAPTGPPLGGHSLMGVGR